jgi:general secretion pathway protein E
MNAATKTKVSAVVHIGPLDWRHIVQWLRQDGVISTQEAQRTVDRCSKAESAQHPLVRLAAVAITRASDGKPLSSWPRKPALITFALTP